MAKFAGGEPLRLTIFPTSLVRPIKGPGTLWPYPDGEQKVVIELKIRHKSREATIERGLTQIAEYMDRCAAAEGHLVIFDRRGDIAWEEKIFREERAVAGKKIEVWGM